MNITIRHERQSFAVYSKNNKELVVIVMHELYFRPVLERSVTASEIILSKHQKKSSSGLSSDDVKSSKSKRSPLSAKTSGMA